MNSNAHSDRSSTTMEDRKPSPNFHSPEMAERNNNPEASYRAHPTAGGLPHESMELNVWGQPLDARGQRGAGVKLEGGEDRADDEMSFGARHAVRADAGARIGSVRAPPAGNMLPVNMELAAASRAYALPIAKAEPKHLGSSQPHPNVADLDDIADHPDGAEHAEKEDQLVPTDKDTFKKSRSRKPTWLKVCSQVVRELVSHQHSWPFISPVDPIALGIPDYFKVVKEPVDLTAIVNGIDSGAYTHFSQVYHHVLLVFKNAMDYNPPENPIHQLALKVRASFASRAMIFMHQLQGMPARAFLPAQSQTEPSQWPPPSSVFPLAPMLEATSKLEQSIVQQIQELEVGDGAIEAGVRTRGLKRNHNDTEGVPLPPSHAIPTLPYSKSTTAPKAASTSGTGAGRGSEPLPSWMTGRAAREAAVRQRPSPPTVPPPTGPHGPDPAAQLERQRLLFPAAPPPPVPYGQYPVAHRGNQRPLPSTVPASVPPPAADNAMRPPVAGGPGAPPDTKPSTLGDVRAGSPGALPPPALQRSHSKGGSCDSNSSGPPKVGRAGGIIAGASASTRPIPASAASTSKLPLSSDVGVLQQEVQQLRQSLDVARKNLARLAKERNKQDRDFARVCEELSIKNKEVEKLNLEKIDAHTRYVDLDQYIEKLTDLNRQQLHSKDEQIAELHQELLSQIQQEGASGGEGAGMEVERPAGGEQGWGEDAQGGKQWHHAAAAAVDSRDQQQRGLAGQALCSRDPRLLRTQGQQQQGREKQAGQSAQAGASMGDRASPAIGQAPLEATGITNDAAHATAAVSNAREGVSQGGGLGQQKASPTGAPGVRTSPSPASGDMALLSGSACELEPLALAGPVAPGVISPTCGSGSPGAATGPPPKGPAIERQAGAAGPGVISPTSGSASPEGAISAASARAGSGGGGPSGHQGSGSGGGAGAGASQRGKSPTEADANADLARQRHLRQVQMLMQRNNAMKHAP